MPISPEIATLDNYNIDIEIVEAALNRQGNYNDYVLRVMRSLVPLKHINYSNILNTKKLTLPETNQKTLILDMDETMIHADFDGKYNNPDHTITFICDGEENSVPIFIRPGLFEFLKNTYEMFEIIVFTAGVKEYADAVLNYLDPDGKYFKYRFYRHNCISVGNRVCIKDLRMFINRKQEDIIIVDNSLYSFSNNLSNGVLINSFYNDKEDRELNNLLNYLNQYLREADDVRLVNEQVFGFSSILNEIIS
jgi:Dullard-like phosphatase family protein